MCKAGTPFSSGQRVVRGRRRVDREAFDQLDDFAALPERKFDEGFQQSQAFCGFARWSSKPSVQLCNKCGIFHLAPSIGNGNGISMQVRKPGPKGSIQAATKAERFGLKADYLLLRTARLGIDRAEPDLVESMPRNNPASKAN
jgi:hypothetical protein